MLGLLLSSLLSAPPSSAGIIIGNGTVGLECTSGKRVRLYDLEEAEKLVYPNTTYRNRPRLTLFHPAGATPRDKFFSIMERVKMRFPNLAAALIKEGAIYETRTEGIRDWRLPVPPNALLSGYPPECRPVGLILQQPRPWLPRDPAYLRADDLFPDMTDEDKAYTELHESVHAIGLANGVEHPKGVRRVTVLMGANEMDTISDPEWIESFRQARIPYYEAANFKFPLFTGDLKPCELPAGARDCTTTAVATWRETHVTYDEQDRVADVSFGEAGGEFEFTTRDSITIKAVAKAFQFDRTSGDLKIAFDGTMTLTGTLTSGANKSIAFDGTISTVDGRIEGHQMADGARHVLSGAVADVYETVARGEPAAVGVPSVLHSAR